MPPLAPEQLEKVDGWLRSVLWESQVPGVGTNQTAALEIHRLKARLVFENGEVKMVQGVREVFEIFEPRDTSGSADNENTPKSGKVVLIGRQLGQFDLETSFLDAIKL